MTVRYQASKTIAAHVASDKQRLVVSKKLVVKTQHSSSIARGTRVACVCASRVWRGQRRLIRRVLVIMTIAHRGICKLNILKILALLRQPADAARRLHSGAHAGSSVNGSISGTWAWYVNNAGGVEMATWKLTGQTKHPVQPIIMG